MVRLVPWKVLKIRHQTQGHQDRLPVQLGHLQKVLRGHPLGPLANLQRDPQANLQVAPLADLQKDPQAILQVGPLADRRGDLHQAPHLTLQQIFRKRSLPQKWNHRTRPLQLNPNNPTRFPWKESRREGVAAEGYTSLSETLGEGPILEACRAGIRDSHFVDAVSNK